MITTYNGDSSEKLKLIDDNTVDLVVTSPPYDNLRFYNGGGDEWTFDKFKLIANELTRVLKDGGVIVWVVNDATIDGSETLTSFKQAEYFKEVCGLNIYDTMIWRKPNPSVPTTNRYYAAFEYMFVISKGIPKAMNFICDIQNKSVGNTYETDIGMNPEVRKKSGKFKTVSEFSRRHNVWDISVGINPTDHPAVYPEQLALDHIITWSNEGDTVLDPFMGSGTTGIASHKTNRHFIGIELDPTYYAIAQNRLGELKEYLW